MHPHFFGGILHFVQDDVFLFVVARESGDRGDNEKTTKKTNIKKGVSGF